MKMYKLLMLSALILMIILLTACASTSGFPDITDAVGFTHHKQDKEEEIQKEQYKAFHEAQKEHPPCGLTINGVCQGTVPYTDDNHQKHDA